MTGAVTGSCTLVVCAAPLAHRWPDIAAALSAVGYTVSVVLTDNASGWDIPKPSPHQPDPRRADTWVIAPLTFNSTAKMALGIADTYAHGLLCEAVGTRAQVVAVPMINEDLFGHPALAEHVRRLRERGLTFVDPQSGTDVFEPVLSGTGLDLAEDFDVDVLVRAVTAPSWAMRWSSEPSTD
ncbi:flavoprotein [Jannaschia sp. R86511]|uniref:flavoprotein n=1 Tax=Jannaschia sp. R86511 TaxID=3093853 RepID=UPI0036D32E11